MAYIKLEDALQVCSEAEEWYTETNEQQCAVVSDDIYQQIANLPTADVVEMVRCSECKYKDDCARQMVHTTQDYVLEQNISTYNKVDFCSYGERRTDDGLY